MASRFTLQQRTELLEAQHNSGLTQKAFCEANQISLATFAYWRRKAKEAAGGGDSAQSVVELQQPCLSIGAQVSVELPGQILIHCRPEQLALVLTQAAGTR